LLLLAVPTEKNTIIAAANAGNRNNFLFIVFGLMESDLSDSSI
jgi:hypothetical protein